MGSRFFNKNVAIFDGFAKGGDDGSPGVFFEGDTLVSTRPLNVEGLVTATMGIVGSFTAGPTKVTQTTIGASAGNNAITAAWKTTYTWNMGAIAGVVGSTNSVIAVDVTVSGAQVGDTVIAGVIGSLDQFVQYQAGVYSAGAVNLRAWYTGSVGALTPGNVPFKVTVIKI
jgi:hypothetical protein